MTQGSLKMWNMSLKTMNLNKQHEIKYIESDEVKKRFQ